MRRSIHNFKYEKTELEISELKRLVIEIWYLVRRQHSGWLQLTDQRGELNVVSAIKVKFY